MADELDYDEDDRILDVPRRARKRALARIRKHLDEMGRDEELLEEFHLEDGLRLNQATLDALKHEVYRRDGEALGARPVEDDYRDFEAGANQDLGELNVFIKRNTAEVTVDETGEKQTIYLDAKAHIAAVKARHEIRKSKLDYKQSLGIIKRAASVPGTHGGRALGDMDAEELKEAILSFATGFTKLVKRYGGKVIDVTPVAASAAPALPSPGDVERANFQKEPVAVPVSRGGER